MHGLEGTLTDHVTHHVTAEVGEQTHGTPARVRRAGLADRPSSISARLSNVRASATAADRLAFMHATVAGTSRAVHSHAAATPKG